MRTVVERERIAHKIVEKLRYDASNGTEEYWRMRSAVSEVLLECEIEEEQAKQNYLPKDMMIYVYRLPLSMSDGYCFGSGVLISFVNVDWFTTGDSTPMTLEDLRKFVKSKRYFVPRATFLVLSKDGSVCFTITKEG